MMMCRKWFYRLASLRAFSHVKIEDLALGFARCQSVTQFPDLALPVAWLCVDFYWVNKQGVHNINNVFYTLQMVIVMS